MTITDTRLELTWVGKNNPEYDIANIEPRILEEDETKSYGDPTTGNMLIHGDNLLALKALLPDYEGKIKCIYIDPPYNTGNAFEHYDDSVEHSIWLSLMKPRLELLRLLLSKDGSIWISIDATESHYLKALCDEIFGRNNFIDEVIWQRSYAPINLKKTLSRSHDTILVYAYNSLGFELNKIDRSEKQSAMYKNYDNDVRGNWKSDNLSVGPAIERNIYPITTPSGRVTMPPKGYSWRLSKERFEEFLQDNRIWFGSDGSNIPSLKRFSSEVKEGVTPMTLWTYQEVGHNQDAKKEIKELFGDDIFDTPKPEKLIQRVVQLGSNQDDIVLDSFLGSGTTSAVAEKMGRRWIGIEMGDHAYTHCKVRLDKVIDGADQGGISKAVDWKGGGGYKFYELAPSFITLDEFGNQVIDQYYNDAKLIKAMCKLMNYTYAPDKDIYYHHGTGQGNNYIYVTTQLLTPSMVSRIASHLAENETLLITTTSFEPGSDQTDGRISVKKIPQSILKSCHFGKKEYLLPIKEVIDKEEEVIDAE